MESPWLVTLSIKLMNREHQSTFNFVFVHLVDTGTKINVTFYDAQNEKKFPGSDSFSSEHQAPLGLTHVRDWKR